MAHGVTAHKFGRKLRFPLSTLVAHLDFPPGPAGSFLNHTGAHVVSPRRISGVPTTGNAW